MSSAQICARLSTLPRKVALPLTELLAAGQLDEDVVQHVLDATDLAGSPGKALGFLAGYLYLQGHGVPMKDTIRMAREQQRRLRLEWSARRWQEEHDRLSRSETLRRLRELNVHYSLTVFDNLLPARFEGYLIRSSRRLGMEGLRQRHCVASYHAQIVAGYCAIASVLLDRKRWTVQLTQTDDANVPLRIVQIRTRFNVMPSLEEQKAIHSALGIAFESGDVSACLGDNIHTPCQRSYMDNLRRILPVLRNHGITDVRVSFDGSGDSGLIEEVRFNGAEIDARSLSVDIGLIYRALEEGTWVTRRAVERQTLLQAIETLTDDYLEETGVNWYDNDGGFGELRIDTERGTVDLEIKVRFTETSIEYSRICDIQTGEELG